MQISGVISCAKIRIERAERVPHDVLDVPELIGNRPRQRLDEAFLHVREQHDDPLVLGQMNDDEFFIRRFKTRKHSSFRRDR